MIYSNRVQKESQTGPGSSSLRSSVQSDEMLDSHSEPETIDQEHGEMFRKDSSHKNDTLESPRQAYMRRKSSEKFLRRAVDSEPSLTQMIGFLLGAGPKSDGTPSPYTSESDTEADMLSCPSSWIPNKSRAVPPFAAIFGREDKNSSDLAVPDNSIYNLCCSSGTVDLYGQGSSNLKISAQRTTPWTELRRPSALVDCSSLWSPQTNLDEISDVAWSIVARHRGMQISSSGREFCAILILQISAALPCVHSSAQLPQSGQTYALAMRVPHEVIQEIYLLLHPRDFNAARHTCRAWMNASLDRQTLDLMLQRGAWRSLYEARTGKTLRTEGLSTFSVHDIWGMSCTISRECALAGGWTGNGCSNTGSIAIAMCDHNWGQSRMLCRRGPRCGGYGRAKVFRQAARILFSDLTIGYGSADKPDGLLCTTSGCGKYVLVAESGMIYVYELFGSNLHHLTSVICPRKVLAMSIDTTSRQLVVAALLEGRMGLMCNIHLVSKLHPDPIPAYSGSSAEARTSHCQNPGSGTLKARLDPNYFNSTFPEISSGAESLNLDSGQNTEAFEIRSEDEPRTIEDNYTKLGREQAHINQTWNLHFPSLDPHHDLMTQTSARGMPIATGTRSLYHQLCSEDDPPRSVAVCPQRQCIAFGCSAGIELHWVDASTGQDLNRWFPLTGPSDYLHFLPPRYQVDSPRKLRLISSAAHPTQMPALARKFASTRTHRDSTITHSFWGSIESETQTRSTAGSVSDGGHYHAVPLSDGFHILFIDPDSGVLCLGNDAPIGDPRRLLRKIMLVPPVKGVVPQIYKPNIDVKEPRIVVAYNDELLLYSIPPDVLELSKSEQQPRPVADPSLAPVWLEWWSFNDAPVQDRRPSSTTPKLESGARSIWPLFVHGTSIGKLNGLVDVAINNLTGRMAIWGFAADGEAAVWEIYSGEPSDSMIVRSIARDGQVMDAYTIDVDGDIVMVDPAISTIQIKHPIETEIDESYSAIFPNRNRELSEDRQGIRLRSGPWFEQYGEDGLSLPIEISGAGVDDVDVYQE